MAKKIEVYRGSKVITLAKKSTVLLAIRRLFMEWIVENVSARYLAIKPAETLPASRVISHAPEYTTRCWEIDRLLGILEKPVPRKLYKPEQIQLV